MPWGRQTVVIGNVRPTGRAHWWHAVWETGAGSALDGAAALAASGLTGYEPERLDVSVPRRNRSHIVDGVRRHRRTTMPPTPSAGLPRVRVPEAAVHAAAWASSERRAALLLCLVLQQRLTTPDRLMTAWRVTTCRIGGRRRRFLDDVVPDLCDGVHSLGELDFARMCREVGLPEPSRQEVRSLPGGRVYLDVRWDHLDLVVEVDGGHHALALTVVDDALRQNEVVLLDDRVLRVPVLGLRLARDRFMDQLVRAHARWSIADAG